MKYVTEQEIMKARRVRAIFNNSPTDLLKEDLRLNTFPEYKYIIENILRQRKEMM